MNFLSTCCYCEGNLRNEFHLFFGCEQAKQILIAAGLWRLIDEDIERAEFATELIPSYISNCFFFSLAMQFLGEWLHARQHPDPPSSVQQSSSRPWTKPQLGSIKVNTDATMFHNQHHYGTNICIRNDQGQFSKSKDNLHVEFTSTSRGISYGSLSSFILGNWNECV